MLNMDNETLLITLVVITGVAVLLQSIILLAIFLTVRKAARSITEQVDELHYTLLPILQNTRDLFNRVAPKFETVATDLVQITHGLRQQTEEIQTSVQEIMDRVHRQSAHMDAMLSGALHAVEQAGGFVAELVRKPVRQVSYLMKSAKTIIEALCAEETPKRPIRPTPGSSPAGRDRFI